jgi:hypothetical protein
MPDTTNPGTGSSAHGARDAHQSGQADGPEHKLSTAEPQQARERLPDRRRALTFEFEHNGTCYTVSADFYQCGRLGEIFINGRKSGSTAEQHAQDAAILVSMLLQLGATPIAGPIATAIKMAACQPGAGVDRW